MHLHTPAAFRARNRNPGRLTARAGTVQKVSAKRTRIILASSYSKPLSASRQDRIDKQAVLGLLSAVMAMVVRIRIALSVRLMLVIYLLVYTKEEAAYIPHVGYCGGRKWSMEECLRLFFSYFLLILPFPFPSNLVGRYM